ncbi:MULTISPECIES: hypothetical protein [Pseudomonas]|uniref:hypothetical protein n=1 Tax=Pseudomonas TaxID=286 RepID=UPI000750AE3D|nr:MULTISPECIES: hypothetical protein [Pseudomonas]ELU0816813.1 hypothetical protein [Pseudomonas putida]MCE0957712.1 hypothetical protein [Pseudomonas putida]MCE0970130.1 hypothetical protein [Pseudomonas putida]MDD1989553.1 hypothetical protein [Pseudomonas putida]MDD2119167.1 hypothetical protein [Pseudomonas putida]
MPNTVPAIPAMRPASQVMDLARLGSHFQSPLSFVRSSMRRMMQQHWHIQRSCFDLDGQGFGTAIYRIDTPNGHYHCVIFSAYLPPEKRSDRVIADQWDVTFVLVKGDVDAEQLADLQRNVPLQEAGRFDARVLVLSRANRSLRNFDRFLAALAEGQQPDPSQLAEVGYLYRTTAVYGNGKFGIADFGCLQDNPDFNQPFSAQMFTVYLLRHFSIEQINHMAQALDPQRAVQLAPALQRYLGVGNATGLGMAPFLINHPQLVERWISTRETALALVLAQPADADRLVRLQALLARARLHLEQSRTEDQRQHEQNLQTLAELALLTTWLGAQATGAGLWSRLLAWAEAQAGVGCQELLASLLLELYPEQVTPLAEHMGVNESWQLDAQMPLGQLRQLIEQQYGWALGYDFSAVDAEHFFWYRSAEKEEPRLGMRAEEPGAEKEMQLGIARNIQQCHAALLQHLQLQPQALTAHFLIAQPAFKGTVRRLQGMAQTTYGEIRANLLARDMLPIHLLRCKLAFFGAGKFDPKSSRWVRITLFQGAPLVSDIGQPFADDWNFAVMPQGER